MQPEQPPRQAPTPITEADRERLREENAKHNAEVQAQAKKMQEADIASGAMPPPLVTSIADSIKKKLEQGDIHSTEEREAEEERLLAGGE